MKLRYAPILGCLIVVIVLALSGCGEKNETNQSTSASNMTQQDAQDKTDVGNSADITDTVPTKEFEDEVDSETSNNEETTSVPEENIDPSDYYDYVLCSGGGYSIVAKQEESVTDVIEYVGVLDDNFNWVVPLSSKTYINPFKGKITGRWTAYPDYKNRCESVSHRLTYVGDDMFVYGQKHDGTLYESTWIGINPSDEGWPDEEGDPKIFHVLTNKWVNIDPDYQSYESIHFTDGYYVAANADSYSKWGDGEYILIINSETGAQETSVYCESCKYIGSYSEGLFFSYDGFYNINCEKVIDLSKYAGLIINRPYFENGKCELITENENGTQYNAVIDNQGNFISEFTKIE